MSIRHDAAYLRAGILVGLVHEADVPAWAEAVLAGGEATPALVDLLLAEVALSPIRVALAPLAEGADPIAVGHALVRAILLDPEARALGTAHRLQMLEHLGTERLLGAQVAAGAKAFGDRGRLAAVGVAGNTPVAEAELDVWLHQHSAPHVFALSFTDPGEASAFLAALSRQVVKAGRLGEAHAGPRVWSTHSNAGTTCLHLDEAAWALAQAQFAPLPLAARIPRPALPRDARLVLSPGHVGPLGAESARALLDHATT